MRKYLYLLLLAVQGFLIDVRAQTGLVYGNIKNTDTKPIEAATVSLLKAKDSSLIKIAVAGKSGDYRFENLQFGSYMIQAEAVDHEKGNSKIFEINNTRPSFAADEIKLASTSKVLNRKYD